MITSRFSKSFWLSVRLRPAPPGEATFSNCFPSLSVKSLIADYGYKVDEPHSETDQMPNQTIGLQVNGVGVKFHAQGIQKVVGFEVL